MFYVQLWKRIFGLWSFQKNLLGLESQESLNDSILTCLSDLSFMCWPEMGVLVLASIRAHRK